MGSFEGKTLAKPTSQNRSRLSPRLGVILALMVVLAIGLGIALYLNRVRNRELRQEMATLQQRMEEVAGKAESAQVRAGAAEQSARQSATAREQAETAKNEAEVEARQAQQRADQAVQKAEAAQKEKEQALAEAERIRKEREEELSRLQEALGKIAETRRTAMGLVMNLDSHAIQFEFDKAALLPDNRELLSRIAGILLTSKGYQITVYGHTDDVGSDAYNQELSERRARSVRDYLVEAGIGPEIITTKGYGKSKPLVEGKTPEARAKNRRVEIGIVDTILDFTPTGQPLQGQEKSPH
jgi:outer membrane protein OmpA-like peptidoglycan-associated protein